jgi:hypothetical protein
VSLYGCGYTYPIGQWGPGNKLQNGAWYRFEYFVDYLDATGQYWYFSGFEIRTDGWPGAIGPAGNSPSASSLSSLYPGDVGIESDPSVLFAEQFDDASLSTVFGRWSDIRSGSTMALTTDVPAGSVPGSRSLDIRWAGGGANNGGHLSRQLPPVSHRFCPGFAPFDARALRSGPNGRDVTIGGAACVGHGWPTRFTQRTRRRWAGPSGDVPDRP